MNYQMVLFDLDGTLLPMDQDEFTKGYFKLLAAKLAGMQAHVNMIPLNTVEETGLRTSSREAIRNFQQILQRYGITATVRRTLGSDIDASCGQLRRKFEGAKKEECVCRSGD